MKQGNSRAFSAFLSVTLQHEARSPLCNRNYLQAKPNPETLVKTCLEINMALSRVPTRMRSPRSCSQPLPTSSIVPKPCL